MTEQYPGGTTGAKVRKVRDRDNLGSWPWHRARTVETTHYRTMFGTESSDFRDHDSRCWDSTGGFSGTILADWIVIEALLDVGHRDGRRH